MAAGPAGRAFRKDARVPRCEPNSAPCDQKPKGSLIIEPLRSFHNRRSATRAVSHRAWGLRRARPKASNAFSPWFGNRSRPAAYRLECRRSRARPIHSGYIPVAKQLHGCKTPLLQGCEFAFHTARIAHATQDASCSGMPYYAELSKWPPKACSYFPFCRRFRTKSK